MGKGGERGEASGGLKLGQGEGAGLDVLVGMFSLGDFFPGGVSVQSLCCLHQEQHVGILVDTNYDRMLRPVHAVSCFSC